VSLVVRLSMILSARPELEGCSSVVKRIRAERGKIDLWSPRWLGKGFTIHRTRQEPVTGEHASPRMHWRRGHLRNQAVGEGRLGRSLRWIEPMLIGAGG
jgi:hypothetical protein